MRFSALIEQDKLWSQRLAERSAGRFSHGLAWLLSRSGDSWLWAVIIVLVLWRQWPLGSTLFWAVTGTAVLVAISKGIFKRTRPSGPRRAIAADIYSFPSGHAARAAAVAITLAFALPAWTLLWVVWATAVSLARVALTRHYLTDVAAGWVVGLGYSVALNVVV